MRGDLRSFGVVMVLAAVVSGSQARASSAEAEAPTFAKDVAPMLYDSGVSCHRPEEIRPETMARQTLRTSI